VFDFFVKRTVDDNAERPSLMMSSSRSEKENDSSFKGANTIKLFGGHKDATSLRHRNRVSPLHSKRIGIGQCSTLIVSVGI